MRRLDHEVCDQQAPPYLPSRASDRAMSMMSSPDAVGSSSHEEYGANGDQGGISISSFRIQGLSPMLYWLDLRACTTSHTVAAPGGCTTIPLAAGKGSGERDQPCSRLVKP